MLLNKTNFFRAIVILPIRLYQIMLSPILPPACRFYPTCSSYAMEAIKIHGVIAGGWLAIKRLCRCHPWGGYGFDPVPKKKSRSSDAGK